MFENLEPLEPSKHGELRLSPATNLAFAAAAASAPLSVTEMAQAARHFPIVFPEATPLMPVALMSLKPGENAFVDRNGDWTGGYVPAHLRRYPFILGNTGEEGRFAVMIDPGAPQFAGEGGEALYDRAGEPTEILSTAIEFLKTFQSEIAATQNLVAPLAEKDVLKTETVTVKHTDGTSAGFEGVRTVDTEKINDLDDATLAAWVRSGLMSVIFAHLNSIDNIRDLAGRQGFITPAFPGDAGA